jgi:hypothetical protein
VRYSRVLVGNLTLGHTNGVIRPRLAGRARALTSWLHVKSGRPLLTTGACELRYNIVGKRRASDEDAARRRSRHDQDSLAGWIR